MRLPQRLHRQRCLRPWMSVSVDLPDVLPPADRAPCAPARPLENLAVADTCLSRRLQERIICPGPLAAADLRGRIEDIPLAQTLLVQVGESTFEVLGCPRQLDLFRRLRKDSHVDATYLPVPRKSSKVHRTVDGDVQVRRRRCDINTPPSGYDSSRVPSLGSPRWFCLEFSKYTSGTHSFGGCPASTV